jgi:hypothetical protein
MDCVSEECLAEELLRCAVTGPSEPGLAGHAGMVPETMQGRFANRPCIVPGKKDQAVFLLKSIFLRGVIQMPLRNQE